MKKSAFSIDHLRRILAFDPATGVFTWLQPLSRKIAIGERAGAIASNGRRYVGVMGEKHLAQRLAWFYHYGEWPDANVRQKNGDYDDCRIDNLELESQAEASRRGVTRSSNTSGIRGVSWSESKRKWIATITRDYHRYHLGYFPTVEEAEAAYEKAAAELPEHGGTPTPTVEQIAERRRLRSAWKRMLRENNDLSGWSSFPHFIADVGKVPGDRFAIESCESDKAPGPGNFKWTEREALSAAEGNRRYRQRRGQDSLRDFELQRRFGLSLADYAAMLKEQNGVCAICHEPETSIRDGKLKQLAVDHDHETGAIRGLLCSNCNPMIGYAKDSPERLEAGAAYLRERKVRSNVVPIKKDTA